MSAYVMLPEPRQLPLRPMRGVAQQLPQVRQRPLDPEEPRRELVLRVLVHREELLLPLREPQLPLLQQLRLRRLAVAGCFDPPWRGMGLMDVMGKHSEWIEVRRRGGSVGQQREARGFRRFCHQFNEGVFLGPSPVHN